MRPYDRVVSLLGSEQPITSDTVVPRQCDAGELIRRRFECGDAAQLPKAVTATSSFCRCGDPQNCRPCRDSCSSKRFKRRASRARDRMYLVGSVTASDLSTRPPCGLLSHFRQAACGGHPESESLVERCGPSSSARCMASSCHAAIALSPRWKTGAYRIDLVVEGSGDTRLAVECDGDEFHGHDPATRYGPPTGSRARGVGLLALFGLYLDPAQG